jgi:hypothetical protein
MALHRTRQRWVSVRTATVNALRGLLYEFGVVLPGAKKAGLKALGAHRAQIDAKVPETMRRLIDGQLDTLKDIGRRIDQLEAEIGAQQTQSDQATKLREVPGIGLLGATALAATLGDGSGWKSGREFSASLGIVPAHSGTGGKARVGHLSKRGDPYLRTLLIHGARAVITHTKDKPTWLEQLLARRPLNVVVAALANKMARTAWALVAHGREYQREWKSTAPRSCPAQAARPARSPAVARQHARAGDHQAKETLRMQLDIFDHSRDVMLRNDVIHALQRRDGAAARAACERLDQECPADESLQTLCALADGLEVAARSPFGEHLALRQARQAVEELQPAAHCTFGVEGAMKWLAPLWEDLALRAEALSFRADCAQPHCGCAPATGRQRRTRSPPSSRGAAFRRLWRG